MVSNFEWNNTQDIQRCEDTLSTLKAMQEQTPTPALERDISRLEKEIELYSQEKLCYEAQILRVRQTSLSLSMCVCVFVHAERHAHKWFWYSMTPWSWTDVMMEWWPKGLSHYGGRWLSTVLGLVESVLSSPWYSCQPRRKRSVTFLMDFILLFVCYFLIGKYLKLPICFELISPTITMRGAIYPNATGHLLDGPYSLNSWDGQSGPTL